ncbi:MAG: sirohydrochlorin cobaltochelatase, partial [Deltaproteobacteria bacterium]|jgi:sirohydrochlorin cobaltochelatase|nr:sirohydrochlorin cobaltochelatase [Deltaproteobacteria bacterium]
MKQGILLAAFGAGNRQGESALRLFDEEVRARFPGIAVRWAFTSLLMRERLAMERKKTDSVRKALEKMAFERYSHVAVQPLQCVPGREYGEVLDEALALSRERDVVVRVGTPLLHSADDVTAAAAALLRHLPAERKQDEAAVWVGHGARHPATVRYDALAHAVQGLDPLVYVGTMSDAAALPRIIEELHEHRRRRVWLLPLLSVVGRHALRDLAGTDERSWKSRFEAAGVVCTPVLKGSAEYPGFIQIWLDHLKLALNE